MTLTEMVSCSLAVWQSVEIWHHGQIFSRPRRALTRYGRAAENPTDDWQIRLTKSVAYGLTCPFCVSVWVAWLYVWLLWQRPLGDFGTLWVFGLAACRLAQLANDVTHLACRSPRDEDEDEKEMEMSLDVFSAEDDGE